MARALRFTEFVEYVLVRLYDLDTGEGDLIDAQQIAAELQEPVPSTWPFEAVEYLDQIGYATAALAMASAQAVIRPAGRIQVEERQRQANTIAHEYRAEPHN